MINLVAIVYNKKLNKILIGRRTKDQFIKQLSWSFPGGRPEYSQDLEMSLKQEIRKKTGINSIEIENIIFARITPEIENQAIIYYYCETEQKEIKAGEKFIEVKWIDAKDYKKYFKTSIHKKIISFLRELS